MGLRFEARDDGLHESLGQRRLELLPDPLGGDEQLALLVPETAACRNPGPTGALEALEQ
jgi:hypothetical protein